MNSLAALKPRERGQVHMALRGRPRGPHRRQR
jgi:hypothetical protein